MTDPIRRGPAIWLAGAAALLLAAGPWLDGPSRIWAAEWGRGAVGEVWSRAAYWAGLGGVQMGLAALWFVWSRWRGDRSGRFASLTALGSVLASGFVAQVIKHLMGRPRPRMDLPAWFLAGPTWDSDFHSFPSGHAATSFALAAVLSARYPSLSWVFYLAACLVAAGRVAGGSHYASDVAAGALAGLLTGLALVRAVGDRLEPAR